LSREHELNLTTSEMQDIEHLVLKMNGIDQSVRVEPVADDAYQKWAINLFRTTESHNAKIPDSLKRMIETMCRQTWNAAKDVYTAAPSADPVVGASKGANENE